MPSQQCPFPRHLHMTRALIHRAEVRKPSRVPYDVWRRPEIQREILTHVGAAGEQRRGGVHTQVHLSSYTSILGDI